MVKYVTARLHLFSMGAYHQEGKNWLGRQMAVTGEELTVTGEAIASPVNMLKYALWRCIGDDNAQPGVDGGCETLQTDMNYALLVGIARNVAVTRFGVVFNSS